MSTIQADSIAQAEGMNNGAINNGILKRLATHFFALSKVKRFLVTVFLVWFLQAVPKWSVAIFASDELSSRIMQMFITPGAGGYRFTFITARHNRHSG